MTELVPGDPASISALAAELARSADRTASARESVSLAERALEESTDDAAELVRERLRAQGIALAETAGALRSCGEVLQRYVVDLQQARALAVRAEAGDPQAPEAQYLASHARDDAAHGARRLAARVEPAVAALQRARALVAAAGPR